MKAVLQRHFGNGNQWDTKPIVCSSWDAYLPAPRQRAAGINQNHKKLGSSALYSKLMHNETSSSPKTSKKNVAAPHKFEMRRAAIKTHKEPIREVDSYKTMKKDDSQLLLEAAVPK
jgi:hypothetical protein